MFFIYSYNNGLRFFLVVLYCIVLLIIGFFCKKHIVLHGFKSTPPHLYQVNYSGDVQYSDSSKKTRSCMEVRLNTPCSKFEITNMVDDQFNLTPEGISGASFSEEEIGQLTVCSTKVLVKMLLYKSKW